MNSCAEALTDFRSAKSNLRKIASFPVCSFSSVMADLAFSSLRTAMYTFALCASSAYIFYNVGHRVVSVDRRSHLLLLFPFRSLFT
jgi:hypothetical protein